MNIFDLKELRSIQGKRINNEVYFHISLIDSLQPESRDNFYAVVFEINGIDPNFIKISLVDGFFFAGV